VKLTDLAPSFVGSGGEGVTAAQGNPVPRREGIGISFDCPCGSCGFPLFVAFANPLDGGTPFHEKPVWQRTGDTFETLTLTPSILRSKEKGGCGWHGYITNGEARSV
jgi:hypothetical protein